MKSFIKNIKGIALSSLFILIAGFVLIPPLVAHANPDQFCVQAMPGASTTPVNITPGNATTTFTINSSCTNSIYGLKSGALLVQFTASSSVSTLQVNEEYSQDGVDWYQGTVNTFDIRNATSTDSVTSGGITTFNAAAVPQYVWKFASSTPAGQAPLITDNLTTRAIPVTFPTQYVRFIFSMKIQANGNGAVWAQFVGKKEIGETR